MPHESAAHQHNASLHGLGPPQAPLSWCLMTLQGRLELILSVDGTAAQYIVPQELLQLGEVSRAGDLHRCSIPGSRDALKCHLRLLRSEVRHCPQVEQRLPVPCSKKAEGGCVCSHQSVGWAGMLLMCLSSERMPAHAAPAGAMRATQYTMH